MAGHRLAVVLLVLVCCFALGQGFVFPILLKKLDLGYWPIFGYRSHAAYQQQQQIQQLQQYQQPQMDYPQREIIQVFPQYPIADAYKTGQ